MGSGQRIAGLVVADLLLEKLAQLLPCQGLAELCTNAEPKATAVEVPPPSLHFVPEDPDPSC